MKHMITWRERSMGSAADYEDAQKRIMAIFKHWKIPESVKVLQFLVRVGDWGGFMLVETDDHAALHGMTTTYPQFEFHCDAVLDIEHAVAAQLEVMAWRDALPLD
jgi:muconolactone delta-isomerase